jgi:hypothetical protein
MGTGAIYHWELEQGVKTLGVLVDWAVVVNEAALAIELAAIGGEAAGVGGAAGGPAGLEYAGARLPHVLSEPPPSSPGLTRVHFIAAREP